MEKAKLDLILRYKYFMVLSPSNSKVELKEFKDDISDVKEIFNIECKGSANIKQITSCVVDETNNCLLITLASMNKLPVAIRGIRVFSQKLMKILEKKRGKEFVTNMIKRKSIFRMISVKEVKNLKLEKSESMKAQETNTELSLVEAQKMITEIFFSKKISEDEEKVKNGILELLGRIKK